MGNDANREHLAALQQAISDATNQFWVPRGGVTHEIFWAIGGKPVEHCIVGAASDERVNEKPSLLTLFTETHVAFVKMVDVPSRGWSGVGDWALETTILPRRNILNVVVKGNYDRRDAAPAEGYTVSRWAVEVRASYKGRDEPLTVTGAMVADFEKTHAFLLADLARS